jgi:hypothetical protein
LCEKDEDISEIVDFLKALAERIEVATCSEVEDIIAVAVWGILTGSMKTITNELRKEAQIRLISKLN